MSELQSTKAKLEREIQQLRSELSNRHAAVGELALADECVPIEEPFAPLLAVEGELAEKINELVERKDRARAILDRVDELESKKRGIEAEHKQLLKELDPLFGPIGQQAFEIYKDNPLVDEQYAEIFSPLIEAVESIKTSEREVEKLDGEAQKRAFLERVVSKGKLALAKNRLSLRKNQLQRLYAKTGKHIAATEFIASIGAPSLDEVSAPYLDRMDAIRRLEADLESTEGELETLSEEYASLCEGLRAKGCVKDLEQLITKATTDRIGILADIGEHLAGESNTAELTEQVASRVNDVESVRSNIRTNEELVSRIAAALEVERLTDQLASIDRSVERKRGQIEEIQNSIAELEENREEVEARKKEHETARGDLADLRARTDS